MQCELRKKHVTFHLKTSTSLNIEPDIWESCYDDNWSGSIVPDAFSHPAKFSRGLIHRIYQHAKEMGWVKSGDWVLDPFGGVALGGLDAMGMGLNWIGVELEEKFVKLGEQNIELWQRQLKGWSNLGTARIIQGDSRNLKFYLAKFIGTPNLVISSPPYEHRSYEGMSDSFAEWREIQGRDNSKPGAQGIVKGYGKSDGQLAGSGDTFWSASLEIVQQCYDLLKSNGHAIWVCKDYVKAKKRVSFSDRWLALCESVGFKLVCRHQAMLKKDYGQIHWINEQIKLIKERKSFFRRNVEDKTAAEKFWHKIDTQIQNEYIEKAKPLVSCKPTEKKIIQKAQILLWKDFLKPVEEIETRIDWEDVICFVKDPDDDPDDDFPPEGI